MVICLIIVCMICLFKTTSPVGFVQNCIEQESPNPFLVLALTSHLYLVPGVRVVNVTECAEAGTWISESRVVAIATGEHNT